MVLLVLLTKDFIEDPYCFNHIFDETTIGISDCAVCRSQTSSFPGMTSLLGKSTAELFAMGGTEIKAGLCRMVETQDSLSFIAAAAAKDTVQTRSASLWPRLRWFGWGGAASGFSRACAEGSLRRLGLVLLTATTSTACFAPHHLLGNHGQIFYCILVPVPFFVSQVCRGHYGLVHNLGIKKQKLYPFSRSLCSLPFIYSFILLYCAYFLL